MKKALLIIFIFSLSFVLGFGQAFAQTDQQLKLTLSRDFGYSGFNNDIQGLFTARISNPPQSVTRVEFYIDGSLMGEDSSVPFGMQFNTDSYDTGLHTISAVGYTSDGTEINSNKIQVQFVPAGSGMQAVIKIVIPIILLVIVIALLAVFLPIVLSKGKLASAPLGEPRKYGVGGGAICPKCNRPFPLRLWWVNLGTKKIDRCPYCGKWSMVKPRSLTELREAEAAELNQSGTESGVPEETDEEKLKRELDDSRYHNM
jgi:DNA-directed RNA polymerase subunit RPC12/RpoP